MSINFHKLNHTNEVFSKLIKEVGQVHDWLAGPAMSERDKLERELAENEGFMGGLTGRR